MRSICSLPTVAFWLALSVSASFGQGTLTPPGAPAPTMKTLDQVEPRIAIPSTGGYYFAPGNYYLTGNISVASGDGIHFLIVFGGGNVNIDLNGFSITSAYSGGSSGYGIECSGVTGLVVRNGSIRGGTTYSSGTYTAGGFQGGIIVNSAHSVHIENVLVEAVAGTGIDIEGGNAVISHCRTYLTGDMGMYAHQGYSTFDHCVADVAGDDGIAGTTASDCVATSNSATGDGFFVNTASNCYGNASGNGVGIDAFNVQNCYGYTGGTGFGILTTTAAGSTGSANSGTGMKCSVASGCFASSISGTGLVCTSATNCFASTNGSASGAYGIDCSATGVAIGCSATSGGGTSTVLRAFIANSCVVGTGTVAITHKYNMP